MKLQTRQNLIKALSFSLIFVLLFSFVNVALKMKKNYGNLLIENFYKEEPNTVDVLFLGTSHTYVSVNPALLWDDHGIASVNMPSAGQPTWNMYYYLKEALKYQQPKLVVLDVFSMIIIQREGELQYGGEYASYDRMVHSNIGMKFSQNKIDSVFASAPKGLRLDLLLGLPVYHNRYEELSDADMQYMLGGDLEESKNYITRWEGKEVERRDNADLQETAAIHEKSLEYFEKTIDLLREKDIPVLLVDTPYSVSDEDRKIINSIKAVAQQKGVDYLEYNDDYDRLGLDFSQDFSDNSHLTVTGATKFTHDLGEQIKSKFDIPDRRGQAGYESWDVCSQQWQQKIRNQQLQQTKKLGDFLALADNENYFVAMYMESAEKPVMAEDGTKEVPVVKVKSEAYKQLGQFHLSTDLSQKLHCDFLAVVDDGGSKLEICGETAVSQTFDVANKKIKMLVPGNTEATPFIMVDQKRVDKGEKGLNIVVFDKTLGIVADSVACDIFKTDDLTRE